MFAKLNNTNVCYNIYGKETEYTLIFIHGYPLDQSMWSPQLELSTQTRIITYDIRGFGKTESGTSEYSIELFAEDLIALIHYLKIKKPILCGFSMGGYIALNAASKLADGLNGLILHDTQCQADSEETQKQRYDSIDAIKINGVTGYATNFLTKMIAAASFNNTELVTWLKSTMQKNSASQLTNTLRCLAERKDTCIQSEDFKFPILIIRGESDEIINEEKTLFMLSKMPHAKYIKLENAGHLSNMENAREFNKSLTDFIMAL